MPSSAAVCRLLQLGLVLMAMLGWSVTAHALVAGNEIFLSANYGLSTDTHGTSSSQSTVADSAGNIYIAGTFNTATLQFGNGVQVALVGNKAGFIAKLDPQGAPVWAARIGGPMGNMAIAGVALDPAGGVHVAGHTDASLTVPVAMTRAGSNSDGFLIRFAADGTPSTPRAVSGASSGNANVAISGLAVDAVGNVYVSGSFNNGALASPVVPLVGNLSGFVAKFGPTGPAEWGRGISGTGASVTAKGVAVDANGGIYVVGNYSSQPLTAPPLALSGIQDVFAIKMDAAGTFGWSQRFYGTARAYPSAVAVDPSGTLHIAGGFEMGSLTTPDLAALGGSTGFLLRLDSTNGTLGRAMRYGGSGATMQLSGVAADNAGNSYLSGYFLASSLTTPPAALTGGGMGLVMKVDTAGEIAWSEAMGGTGVSVLRFNGLSLDAASRAYLAGEVSGAITTPPLTPNGSKDAVFVKYGMSGQVLTVTRAGTGSGSVTAVGGLNCGLACVAVYATNTPVTLTATPASGSSFAGWSGNCTGTSPAASVAMATAQACTATFSTAAAPAPTPAPLPNVPQIAVPIDTMGSGQGTVSLAAALGNPAPGTIYTVSPAAGGTLPAWLSFDPATLSFTYDVPLPPDLPVQPVADTRATDTRAARPVPPNRVYPLAIRVQTVPVLITVNSGGSSASYVVTMEFYAPRNAAALTAVSYSADGRAGNGASGRPALSWDGGQVLFETAASNLSDAHSDHTKIGRYHGLSGKRDLVAQTAVPGGGVANATPGPATSPAVSADGAFGAFAAAGGGVSLTPNSPLRQIYRTALAFPRVSLNEAVTPAAVMVSTSAANLPADQPADNPAIGRHGALVAFESAATNLGENPQRTVQVWRKDMADGGVVLVSSSASGLAGNGDSRNVSLSWDGRYAAFDSTSTNLVAGVSGRHIYLKDLQTGAIQAVGAGSRPRMDARATGVAFTAGAQVAWFDRATGQVATVAATGDQATVSADGRFVAWRAEGASFTQVWVRDILRGQTALVSQTAAGAEGGGNSYDPALSGDGGTIAFGSRARDLVNGNPPAGQIHLAANPLVLPGRTAHWTVNTGGNQAWAIERWGTDAYVANLAYGPDGGIATWAAGRCRFDGLVCRGTIQGLGNVAATFDAGGNTASLTMNGAAVPLSVYPVMGTSTTAFAGLPQGGWWYDAGAADNTGVFLSFGTQTTSGGLTAQTAHLSLFAYDTTGRPVWYAAEGRLGPDLSLDGTLLRYAGGAPIGTTGGAVAPSAVVVGPYRLTFTGTDSAQLRLPDGRVSTLARFRF